METDVYFICPNCEGITNGKGSNDSPKDQITCCKCNQNFSAIRIGKLKPWSGKELPERYLYIGGKNYLT
jgi:hypothetical protein